MLLRFDYLENKLFRAKSNLSFWKTLPDDEESREAIKRFTIEKKEIQHNLKLTKNESQETNLH